MSARRRAALALVLAALWTATVAPSPTPTPTPPPVFVVHRTAAGAHVPAASANPLLVLVIGSDVREGDPGTGRADSLHVVALNTATRRGTILGIPRDAYVPVPGKGRMKIAESLYHGGPGLTVRAVEEATGLTFHYWAIVEFSRFRALVDRLGGVEVDVPARMADANSGAFFEPGRRHMNGAEALAFARNRYDAQDGDIGRSHNHGLLMLAALEKFRAETQDPFGVLRYLDAFASLVSSNLPLRDMLVLASIGRRVEAANVRNVVVPVRLGTVGAASVVFLEPAARAMFDAVRGDGEL